MVRQTEKTDLTAAWRALAGQRQAEGWQTIPIASDTICRLLAGRHFPGNEEALLLGLRSVTLPGEEMLPQGHGFFVTRATLEQKMDGWNWIALCRQPSGNVDLFEMMAVDIVATLKELEKGDGKRLLDVFLARIHAWQEFMRRGKRHLLTPEGEIGLYGELEIVEVLMSSSLPAPAVLDSWQGPLDGLHDFRIGAGGIEVKSTASPASFPAKIGSLDQLDDSHVSPLFLAGVQLELDAQGMTLGDKIERVRDQLSGLPSVREHFDRLLLHAGFADEDSENYTRKFRHVNTKLFRITESFPRLTRSDVRGEITYAQYEVDLNLVDENVVDLASALEQLGVEK